MVVDVIVAVVVVKVEVHVSRHRSMIKTGGGEESETVGKRLCLDKLQFEWNTKSTKWLKQKVNVIR